MPVDAFPEAEAKTLYESMRPQLTFMLEERKVPYDVIVKIASLDILTTNQYSRVGRNDDDFVAWLEEDVGVKKTDAGGRSLHARLLDALDLCRKLKEEESAVVAKARATGQPAEITGGAHLELRKTYQAVTGSIRDELYPSYAYFNARLQELEDNELTAETLDAVTSRRYELQQGNDDYAIQWNRNGEAVMKRFKLKGQLPKTTEDYRATYKIMAHHWALVRLRHGGRPFLKDLEPDVWAHHVDFMLGEEVRGLNAKDAAGNVVASISWHTFLVYDQEVRNAAMKAVNERGLTIANALVEARKCNELRTKFLVTQLALAHLETTSSNSSSAYSRAPAVETSWNDGHGEDWKGAGRRAKKGATKNKGGKGGGSDKAKGKGKPKSKGKADGKGSTRLKVLKKAGLLKVGAEGSCFNFNKPGGCSNSACNWPHICAHCGGRHSLENCPAYATWEASQT